jgi:predicted nucleic acid-binding protein
MFLLDTNVLFAAVFQAHAHHETVSRWLATAERYATCGLTQIGTFRLLLTAEATNYSPLTPADAHAVLTDFARAERHIFPSTCPGPSPEFVGQTTGHKAAFDDYLVQIAHAACCKLATLDRALTRRWDRHTVLMQPQC